MTKITQTSPLGDRTVHRLGYGAMQLAGTNVIGPPQDPDAARGVATRDRAWCVDHIDTAAAYGPNVVNKLIAETLCPYPEDLVIATKVGGVRDEQGGWIRASRPEQLRQQVEENLALLKVERLDLVNMRFGVGSTEPDLVPPMR